MKKKTQKKLALHRETLQDLSGAAQPIGIEIGSADPCKSCLCISEPESVCLCSNEAG